jgi:Calcineurin-like phosphoesterase
MNTQNAIINRTKSSINDELKYSDTSSDTIYTLRNNLLIIDEPTGENNSRQQYYIYLDTIYILDYECMTTESMITESIITESIITESMVTKSILSQVKRINSESGISEPITDIGQICDKLRLGLNIMNNYVINSDTTNKSSVKKMHQQIISILVENHNKFNLNMSKIDDNLNSLSQDVANILVNRSEIKINVDDTVEENSVGEIVQNLANAAVEVHPEKKLDYYINNLNILCKQDIDKDLSNIISPIVNLSNDTKPLVEQVEILFNQAVPSDEQLESLVYQLVNQIGYLAYKLRYLVYLLGSLSDQLKPLTDTPLTDTPLTDTPLTDTPLTDTPLTNIIRNLPEELISLAEQLEPLPNGPSVDEIKKLPNQLISLAEQLISLPDQIISLPDLIMPLVEQIYELQGKFKTLANDFGMLDKPSADQLRLLINKQLKPLIAKVRGLSSRAIPIVESIMISKTKLLVNGLEENKKDQYIKALDDSLKQSNKISKSMINISKNLNPLYLPTPYLLTDFISTGDLKLSAESNLQIVFKSKSFYAEYLNKYPDAEYLNKYPDAEYLNKYPDAEYLNKYPDAEYVYSEIKENKQHNQDTYCTRYTDSDVFAFSDVHGDFLALITYLQDCAKVIKLSDGVKYHQMLEKVKYNYQITNDGVCKKTNTVLKTYSTIKDDLHIKKNSSVVSKPVVSKKVVSKEVVSKEVVSKAVVSEDIRLKQKKHLLDIINNDNSEYDSTYGFEWCGKNSLVIITGDLIDNYRNGTVGRNDRIINEEIKIVLFLRKLARKAQEVGGNVITLYGNHEYMNIKYDNTKNFFINPYEMYIDPISKNEEFVKGVNRLNFFNDFDFVLDNFLYEKKDDLYKVLRQDKLAIYKINNIIFVHGGITPTVIELIYDKLEAEKIILSVDNFIIKINDLFNDMTTSYDKTIKEKVFNNGGLLWDRTFGTNYDPSTYCIKLLDIFSLLCSYNNRITDSKEIKKGMEDMVFVMGHCTQDTFTFNLDKSHNPIIKLNTSHSKINKSDNHHIINGKIIQTKFDNELKKKYPIIFGITSNCSMDNKNIGQIYKIDIGSSRSFDTKKTSDYLESEYDKILIKDDDTIKIFLIHILKQHYVSRLPQVVHFTFCKNKIISSKIRRALLSKTLIRMERDNYFPFNKKGKELGLDIIAFCLLKDIDSFEL